MTKRNCTTQNPSKQVRKKSGPKVDTSDFIERSKKVHGDKFGYEVSEYKTAREPILVTCKKHGVVETTPRIHLEGAGCSLCGDESRRVGREEFVRRSKIKHGNFYDYSLTDFELVKEYVKIICPVHGVFTQAAYTHMGGAGCINCSGYAKVTKPEFIARARAVHGEKYNYDKVRYRSIRDKVIISCDRHGDFSQSADSHYQGNGCKKCAGYGAFTLSRFISACNANNKGWATLYVIECLKGKERFFKVGITSHFTEFRFRYGMPYKYKIICEIKERPRIVHKLEIEMHEALKGVRYSPDIVFSGHTECFSDIRPIKRLLKALTETEQLQLIA